MVIEKLAPYRQLIGLQDTGEYQFKKDFNLQINLQKYIGAIGF